MKLSRIILLVLIVFFIGQIAYFYPQLPEKVAIHFGLNGQADSWTSKQGWLIFQAILLAVFLFLSLGLPRLVEKTDDKFINIPNKEYWLSNERRIETFTILREKFQWFGVALIALLTIISFDTINATLNGSQKLSNLFFVSFFGFLVFVVIWIITLNRNFKKTL